MKKIIEYFATKHLFSNFLFFSILIGGVFFWNITSKEELPEMAFDTVLVTVNYPGASPQDVEQLVTWPIEKELTALHGIEDINSTSKEGSCTIIITLEKGLEDQAAVVTEIRNSVLNTKLPDEIIENPQVQQFNTAYKAVIDIGLYLPQHQFLSDSERRELQLQARNLEKRLLALPQIKSINRRGYLNEELQIVVKPERLIQYQLPITTLIDEIKTAHSRQPAGSLESAKEERITIEARLDTRNKLEELPVQGTFEGSLIQLKKLADIYDTFEESDLIVKLNGHEGIILNAVKSSTAGILDAVDAIKKEVSVFQNSIGKGNLGIVLLDDESADVRNRLQLISANGLLGFILIIILLFVFLSFRAGFWVAMGIPFTFCLTMIITSLSGFTINNVTLAAVIIVMGMIVDDAIVVSENIMRLRGQGMPIKQAAIEGTTYVLLPITASILTTCFAFLPLLSFDGWLSILSDSIPPIVTIMLLASLLEAIIILPAHLSIEIPRWLKIIMSLGAILLIEKYYKKTDTNMASITDTPREHWFHSLEEKFSILLAKILKRRVLIMIIFILFIIGGLFITCNTMKFVQFPREESTEISVVAVAPAGTKKETTARLAEGLEKVFINHLGKEVVGFRTRIGQSFHRSSGQENMLRLIVELKPADQREKSLNELLPGWEQKLKAIKGFDKIRVARHRWGSSSSSPIEIVIKENDNEKRDKVADRLAEELKKLPWLDNIEIDRPYASPEYQLLLKRDIAKRLNIDATDVATAIRATLEGNILYQYLNDDEDKNVRITLPSTSQHNLNALLNITIGNNEGYLVPLKSIVKLKKTKNPSEIIRINRQRVLKVYANIRPKVDITPLEVAEYLEKNIFPRLSKISPGTTYGYEGEIKTTRESLNFFLIASIMVVMLIYITLSLSFNSLLRPFIIMLGAIPAAITAVLLIFILHGMNFIGFFGVIGLVGLSGVVVNDAIILIRKLDNDFKENKKRSEMNQQIAYITSTRLRAIFLTTITTVMGLFPTAYGIFGYDSILGEMMLAVSWGLICGTIIILIAIPTIYSLSKELSIKIKTTRGL